jgi:hypothetical protein
MKAMALHQVCMGCRKDFTGAGNYCPGCNMVGMTLKHEGEVGGKVIGPLFIDFEDGHSKHYGILGAMKWYNVDDKGRIRCYPAGRKGDWKRIAAKAARRIGKAAAKEGQ